MTNEVLRLLRVFSNYKSSELAEELGISKSYLSEIEHEKKKPTIELLEKYAKIFNIKVSTIFLFSEAIENDLPTNYDTKQRVARYAVKWLELLDRVGRIDEEAYPD